MSELSFSQWILCIRDMVQREYGLQLQMVFISGGCHNAYLQAIRRIESLPIEQQRMIAVQVSLDEIDLLRYPALDIELSSRPDVEKLGCNGKPENVAEFMRLIYSHVGDEVFEQN